MGFSIHCHTWPEVLILLSEIFNGYVKNEILSRRKESYLTSCEILNNPVWLIFQDRCVVKCGETGRFAIYCIVDCLQTKKYFEKMWGNCKVCYDICLFTNEFHFGSLLYQLVLFGSIKLQFSLRAHWRRFSSFFF